VIVSASRRTDIPAFYAEWFMNRVRAGSALVSNPVNPRQVSRVGLAPEEVDAFVFWTRDAEPLMPYLEELDRGGYLYYFLYTLTGYPPGLEPAAPPADRAVRTMATLAGRIGSDRLLWRYDPVLVSHLTPEDLIVENFRQLAGELTAHTGRVIVSPANFYRKTRRNLQRAGIGFTDLEEETERAMDLMGRLARAARAEGLHITSCASKLDLREAGIGPGRCVDDRLLNAVFGLSLPPGKDPSQRPECLCATSRDIGAYHTCTHGCLYCYANDSPEVARKNRARHHPEGEALLPLGRAA
jgi:hypothetical protein